MRLDTPLGLLFLLLLLLAALSARCQEIPRPDHSEHARLARWLVHYNSWGTLSTQGDSGSPSSGVASFVDGPPSSPAAGRLFFYLTPMDETGHHIQDHPECALSVSEAQLHPAGCGTTDPMEPTCARISVLGRMLPIEAADRAMAQQLLFEKHPAMKGWPADHGFGFYELHLREIHMLDFYGGMHILTPDEYYSADLQPPQPQQQQEGELDHQQQQQEGQAHGQQPPRSGARSQVQHQLARRFAAAAAASRTAGAHHQQQQQPAA